MYRQRIGCFSQNSSKKKMKVNFIDSRKNINICMSFAIRILLLFSICLVNGSPRDFVQPGGTVSSIESQDPCPQSREILSSSHSVLLEFTKCFHPVGRQSSSSKIFVQPSGIPWPGSRCLHPVGRKTSPPEIFFQPCRMSRSYAKCFHPTGRKPSFQETFLQPCGISWSYTNNGNKLTHALSGNKKVGYKYLAWNCDRGFLSERKIDDLKVAINRHKPHLVGVSEIDLHRNENNLDHFATNYLSTEQLNEKLQIQGYKIFLPKSWETLGKARIIVYAKDDMKVKHLYPQDQEYFHIQNITLEVGFGRSKTHFCNFYYREWTSSKNGRKDSKNQEDDLALLLDIWRNCTASVDKDFVALGDMNLCAKRWDEQDYQHKELANKLKDFMNEENCAQLVDSYTRIRSVGGNIQRSCIDHATVNCVNKITAPIIVGVGKSDHLGVILTKASKEVRTCTRTTRKRIYKHFDKESFLHDLKVAKAAGKFLGVHSATNPDEAFDAFEKAYSEVLDPHAPIKVIQNRKDYVPYISSHLEKMMAERNTLKEEAAISGHLEDFNKYKKKRNEVSSLLKNAEKEHYGNKFNDENLTTKTTWKIAYEVLGKFRSSFPSQILHGGRLLSKPAEIATEVNKFFIDKIKKLKEEFSVSEEDDPISELKKYLSKKSIPREGFSLKELNDEDVEKLLKQMKGKKSLGLDWICGFSLKLSSECLREELKALINISIRKHKFVEKWKCSKILPGWKNKGNRFELKFYRPISNLSEVSKLVEKAVYDQMYDYLQSNDLIHTNHHDFLKGCSTSTALQHMLDIWLQHLDKGKLTSALFLDLSAGFDVVNHDILLRKMKEYNFTSETISWFSSYLLDRSQCVQIESSFSPSLPVPWGVPQGSILGPLLFLLFLNELPDIVKDDHAEETEASEIPNENDVIIYADDNTPITADKDPLRLQEKIQDEANIVTGWFSKNDMICSSDKTKLLIIGTNANRKNKLEKKNLSLKVEICGEEKQETTSEKLLGVIVNNTATFKHHLYGDHENPGLMKQLSTRAGMLSKLKKYLPPAKLKLVMEGMFSSKLMYGMSVWSRVWQIPGSLDEAATTRTSPSITKEDVRKLQVLQNKCLRIVSNSDYKTPTLSLLKKTKSLSVHQMMAQLSLSQVYSTFRTELPVYHYDRLFRINSRTRNVNDFSVNRIEYKLSQARTNFFYQSSRLWSAIPEYIKSSRNKFIFKKKCKAWVKMNIMVRP